MCPDGGQLHVRSVLERPLAMSVDHRSGAAAGTMPEEWGKVGSWTSLTELNMTTNDLTGKDPL